MGKKLVFGVGVNDAGYVVQQFETIGYVDGKRKQKFVWMCPFYSAWTGMLERGYSAKEKERYPTYKDVTVCEEWHLFSNFKSWMEQQPFEGMRLDKDLLVKGNKEYNPSTCVFVPNRVNTVLVDSGAVRGVYPLGVYYKQKTKYMVNELKKPHVAKVSTGDGKGQKHLGMFSSPFEAHKAWQLAKANVIEETIEWWQFNDEVKHTYRQDVADALFERAVQLRTDVSIGIETIEL